MIVPCRNEVGNVAAAVERVPDWAGTPRSSFATTNPPMAPARNPLSAERIPGRDIKLYDGPGICKALNVWTGFDRAEGDILMILDADLTTMPEELPYFYDAIASGKAEFVNGTRFVFPMEGAAMRPLNILGNRFFSAVFSIILGQTISDTLCGTKVLLRRDWPAVVRCSAVGAPTTAGATTTCCSAPPSCICGFSICPCTIKSGSAARPR